MTVIRSIILASCILAVVSAGAVRSSPEDKKTDVTSLTSNLLKAASDSSSPGLLRKGNKTMETVYTKMENEESVELAHEKEMDQVYRSRIGTLNTKFNATVEKEKKKRKAKQALARAVYVNGTDGTSRVIRKIKSQIKKIKENARKAKETVSKELLFRRKLYKNGTCCTGDSGKSILDQRIEYLLARLTVERQRRRWKRKVMRRMQSVTRLLKSYIATANAGSRHDTEMARSVGKMILNKGVQYIADASESARQLRMKELGHQLSILADIRSGLEKGHFDVAGPMSGSISSTIRHILRDQNNNDIKFAGELRHGIKEKCEKRVANFGGDAEICSNIFVMKTETLFRDAFASNLNNRRISPNSDTRDPMMWDDAMPLEKIDGTPTGVTGISGMSGITGGSTGATASASSGATGATGSDTGITGLTMDEEGEAEGEKVNLDKEKHLPDKAIGAVQKDILEDSSDIGSTNAHPSKNIDCKKHGEKPCRSSPVVSKAASVKTAAEEAEHEAASIEENKPSPVPQSEQEEVNMDGKSFLTSKKELDKVALDFAKYARINMKVFLHVFNTTGTHEDALRTCFYKSSLNASDSGLEEIAFTKAGTCVSSGGLLSSEKANEFSEKYEKYQRVGRKTFALYFESTDGQTLLHADNKFVINSCFDKIDENHVQAWRKGSLSKQDFVKAILCVTGGDAKNVPKSSTLTKLELAKKVDATDYTGALVPSKKHLKDYNAVSKAAQKLEDGSLEQSIELFKRVV